MSAPRNTPTSSPLSEARNLASKLESRIALVEAVFLNRVCDFNEQQTAGMAYTLADMLEETQQVSRFLDQVAEGLTAQLAQSPADNAERTISDSLDRTDLCGVVLGAHSFVRSLVRERPDLEQPLAGLVALIERAQELASRGWDEAKRTVGELATACSTSDLERIASERRGDGEVRS